MEIILSNQCQSLTGSLGQGFGYSIQRQRGKFVSKRNSKGEVPADGHLRFIFACAELAQAKLHISDIRVTKNEVLSALISAGKIDLWPKLLHICESCEVKSAFLNAHDIFYFKNSPL
jgi:hypothetical protein